MTSKASVANKLRSTYPATVQKLRRRGREGLRYIFQIVVRWINVSEKRRYSLRIPIECAPAKSDAFFLFLSPLFCAI